SPHLRELAASAPLRRLTSTHVDARGEARGSHACSGSPHLRELAASAPLRRLTSTHVDARGEARGSHACSGSPHLPGRHSRRTSPAARRSSVRGETALAAPTTL